MAAERWHFECPSCTSFRFADLDEHDGKLFRDVRVSKGLRAQQIETSWDAESKCTGCGRRTNAKRVEGKFSIEHVCDPACTSAIGDLCVCQCGGANHGISHNPWAAYIVYYVVFNPTGSRKKADKRIVEATPEIIAERQRLQQEREAKKAADKLVSKRASFGETYGDVADWLVENEQRQHRLDFVRDMAFTYERKGELSQAQAEAVRRIMTKDAEFKQRDRERAERIAADRAAAVTPAPSGTATVSGTIVAFKFQRSQFGDAHDPNCLTYNDGRRCYNDEHEGVIKMIVKLDDHNTVWSSIPSAMYDVAQSENVSTQAMKGWRVTFTASFERSERDEHFSFAKRPRKFSAVKPANGEAA